MGTPQSILDAGCGLGNSRRGFREAGYDGDYFGFDCSVYAIEQAKRYGDCNARFEVSTMQTFDPQGETFDLILFHETIYYMHIGEVRDQLKRYQTMLNPNGRILIRLHYSPYPMPKSKWEAYGRAIVDCGGVPINKSLYGIAEASSLTRVRTH